MSGKKKGKLSKAERERLQREEEERQLKEEEERLLAEKEEAERLEREQKLQEERDRLEAKDLERRESELIELHLLLDGNRISANNWYEKLRKQAKWNRYMRCDGSPDPSITQEINTFINLSKEDNNKNTNSMISNATLAINLTDELENLLAETPAHEMNEKDIVQHKETIINLQNLVHFKYDEVTEEILKHSTESADPDTGNMQMVIKKDDIIICLWANLSKDPRFKGYEFPETGLAFELPKPLASMDIVVRFLYSRHDHLSSRSQSFHLQVKNLATNVMAEPEPNETKDIEVDQVDGEQKEETENLRLSENEPESVSAEDRKSSMSLVSNKDETKSLSERKTEEEEQKPPENMADETTECVTEEAPIPAPTETTFVLDENVFDLRQYRSLGGIYYFDVFRLPPQPTLRNGWTMVELVQCGMYNFPYPFETQKINNNESEKTDEKEIETLSLPPVGVSVRLPDNVLFLEQPKIGRWDFTSKEWKMDRITNVKYDQENKSITFTMDTFYTFAFMQDCYINMPFQSWELRPLGVNNVVLTVTAAITEVQIEVKGDECRLNCAPAENSVLSHIGGQWMNLKALINAMRSVGVNIFVEEDSYKYASINAKNSVAEKAAYEQMALLSSAYAFAWSRWNAESGTEHVVMKVSEHLKTQPVDDEDWKIYMVSSRRAMRLKITEYSDAFSDDLAENSEFHSTFLHMIKDGISEEALERMNQSHFLFIDCMQKLLNATKVLTFS
ncbi:dynein axonemal intermediate chain 7 [Erpetoichthys calabaricus]|uniref:dynein axonemal intermediate chain 7 n=1 Tax=Erpetoichthys calabaricus TaxID=27687 RepID=UPI00223403B2|nr:dynein axonemal intermediate chain 7 [Erpetoichthys calabaricus]